VICARHTGQPSSNSATRRAQLSQKRACSHGTNANPWRGAVRHTSQDSSWAGRSVWHTAATPVDRRWRTQELSRSHQRLQDRDKTLHCSAVHIDCYALRRQLQLTSSATRESLYVVVYTYWLADRRRTAAVLYHLMCDMLFLLIPPRCSCFATPALSTPALSTPVSSCRLVHSRIVNSRDFSAPVWGTPATFNGFRVLAALLHGM